MIYITELTKTVPRQFPMDWGERLNSLTGIIIFENSSKNMDTMDRIPCCSVSMHIKHFKLGQATDHICGIKQKITYRHWPP